MVPLWATAVILSSGTPRLTSIVAPVAIRWHGAGVESFQSAQKLDQIAQIVFGKDLPDPFGHGRKPFLAILDISLLDRNQTSTGCVEDKLIVVFTLQNAGIVFIIFQCDHHALEARSDLTVR